MESLHQACRAGDIGEVKRLINANANIYTVDRYGWVPIHLASYIGCANIVKCLIEAKSDPNMVDETVSTPLMYASRVCRNEETVALLIRAKANVNHVSYYGITAIQYASRYGHIGMVHILLDAKADIHQADNHGNTPISDACFNNNVHMVQSLIQHKALVDDIPVKPYNSEITQLLIEAKANPDLSIPW